MRTILASILLFSTKFYDKYYSCKFCHQTPCDEHQATGSVVVAYILCETAGGKWHSSNYQLFCNGIMMLMCMDNWLPAEYIQWCSRLQMSCPDPQWLPPSIIMWCNLKKWCVSQRAINEYWCFKVIYDIWTYLYIIIRL